MATIHLCDGCAKPADALTVVGVVVKHEYCLDCAVLAKRFLEVEDELRVELTTRFSADRAALIERYSAGGFRLPDVLT